MHAPRDDGIGEYCPPAPTPLEHRLGIPRLLLTLKRNPLECWSADFFREPISRVRLPFCQAFLVNDPSAIKRVLVDNAENYDKDSIQRRILSAGLADGLLGVEGNRWQAQRRTLASLFARKTIVSFTSPMLSAADSLTDRWKRIGRQGPIDISAEMTLLTLNVLALTIFSDGISGDLDEFRLAMRSYFETIGRIGVFDLLGISPKVPRPGRTQLKRTVIYFEDIVDEMIARRQQRLGARNDAPEDILTLLLRATDPSTGRPMSLREVKSNILTFLSAGHETTANTLSCSFFLLSQSPYWRKCVCEEADRELRGPHDGLINRLIVTKAVVEEALRLYPPISALSRMASQADTLGSCAVPRGSLVVVAPYVLHRQQRLWDRPFAFDPTRFLEKSREKIGRFSYLPFGTGPRTCIGAAFALQEATLVLATLMHRFEMRLSSGAEVWPLQRVTLRPAKGLPMHVTPRRSDAPI
ncbi:cytochrome P450 [Bradyrhizobium sp. 142]|nr:cytochrome P450 [Bradyrhizobium sp. 142]MCK1730361.1 cytochrome P450 [Bradyrhizobium sp. 142]